MSIIQSLLNKFRSTAVVDSGWVSGETTHNSFYKYDPYKFVPKTCIMSSFDVPVAPIKMRAMIDLKPIVTPYNEIDSDLFPYAYGKPVRYKNVPYADVEMLLYRLGPNEQQVLNMDIVHNMWSSLVNKGSLTKKQYDYVYHLLNYYNNDWIRELCHRLYTPAARKMSYDLLNEASRLRQNHQTFMVSIKHSHCPRFEV